MEEEEEDDDEDYENEDESECQVHLGGFQLLTDPPKAKQARKPTEEEVLEELGSMDPKDLMAVISDLMWQAKHTPPVEPKPPKPTKKNKSKKQQRRSRTKKKPEYHSSSSESSSESNKSSDLSSEEEDNGNSKFHAVVKGKRGAYGVFTSRSKALKLMGDSSKAMYRVFKS